jgi:preprotein translocase subunit SecD
MRKRLLGRFIVILIVLAVAVFSYLENGITPALDLQGGVMFVLRVQTDEAVRAETSQNATQLKNYLESEGLTNYVVQADNDKINVRINDDNAAHKETVENVIDDHLDEFEYLDPIHENGEYHYSLTWVPRRLKDFKKQTVEQVKNTLSRRIDEIGVEEPNITTQQESTEEAGERIIIQLPGLEDTDWAKDILKRQAYLQWVPVTGEPGSSEQEVLKQFGGTVPEGHGIYREEVPTEEGKAPRYIYYCLKEEPIITGAQLKYARFSQDEHGRPAVGFYLKATAADIFWDYTGSHLKERLAIVLDGKVISAPTIQAQIADNGIITGAANRQEANTLALLLRSGALPAKPVFLHETRVGPTLGADSKEKGIKAAVLGLVVVMIFMIIYYKIAGINSVIALILNIILVLGALAMLKAKLSLPGIAGLILTIGMAVDANVLIFERIREELDTGKTIRSSVNSGFGKALLTIFDANITTLIAAFFLLNFGTGPIRGFAIVLMIGILASLFTAIFVSRTLFLFLFKILPGTEKQGFGKILI